MPEFVVRLHEPPSGTREARVRADRPAAAVQALGVDPRRVISVSPVPPAGRPRGAPPLRLFAHELAVLLEAGVPLIESLQTLRERDGRQTAVLDRVIDALTQGLAPSRAFASAPEMFDELFVALVGASERSGQLATTLKMHAAYLAWSDKLRERLASAAVYPLLLLLAGGAVVVFLLLYVLPRFAGIFDGLDRDLPWASQVLMALGVLAAAHPVVSLAVAVAPLLAAVAAWRWPALRRAALAWCWRIPSASTGLRTIATARLYRGLGLLLAAGIPVRQALPLMHGVVAEPLREAVGRVAADIDAGSRLSQAMQAHGLATPVALRMLRVGESSGEVAAMLERAAAFHDDEIERWSEFVTRTVNPLLMLVMGVVIGGIVVLMYLPIFTLMEQVQ